LGDPGRDDYCGWGRVDARAALDMVLAYRCDLNKDWKVDEQDLAILTAAIDANDLSADVAPVKKRDGIVDAKDVALLRRCLGTLIPEMGLIAHWKLDETEGVLAGDSTGWNHHATVTGNSLWRADGGTIGGALELDGKSFTTADLGLDPAGGPFSIFAWVRGGRPGQVIISQDNTGNLLLAGSNWLLTDPATGAMMTELVPPPGRTPNPPLVSDKVITDGDWHRIGFTWDGVTRALYVDDALVAKDAQSNLASCSGGLHFGCDKAMTPGTFWKGLIDDVRIYGRVVRP
jgi:hypothetical protein